MEQRPLGREQQEPDAGPEAGPAGTAVAEDSKTHPLVAVVVPTYNEADNLPELVRRLSALKLPNARLIVVDDGSPDGTERTAMGLSDQFGGRLEVIQRGMKLGLRTAYVEGFRRALAEGADVVLQMDADLSHLPEYIPAFLKHLDDADVVVGSRYVKGGQTDGTWSLSRCLLSYLGNSGIRAIAGLHVRDATSGFKAFRGKTLESLDLSQCRCEGFGFQAEVAFACQRRGLRVVEHPIEFATRAAGHSKMSWAIVFEAIWMLLPLRWNSQV